MKIDHITLLVSSLEHSMPYYEHLLAAGKRKKVALVACMRKLLTMLNAIAKHCSTWNPNHHCA